MGVLELSEKVSSGGGAEGDKRTPSRVIFAIATGLFALFLATGEYALPYGTDTFTNAVQARAFADDQSPFLEELESISQPEYQGTFHWLVDAPDGPTAQYPPGTALWAAPFYLFDTSLQTITVAVPEEISTGAETETFGVPGTLVPATVAAALSVAIAMAFFGLTISPHLPSRATVVAMLAGALGTGAWSVAADKLWQHGPAMMWISIGTYFASRDRFALSGVAFAIGVATRPHSAVIAAGVGLAVAISRRSLREVSALGAISFLGVLALSAYNDFVFGEFTPLGGYRVSGFTGGGTNSPALVAGRLLGAIVHTQVGILWTSPVIVVALIAVVMTARRHTPDWAIGAAIGGLLYLVVQFRSNRLTGGEGFFSYRYPLEALMAAGPMFAFATWQWIKDSPLRHRLVRVTIVISIVAHGVGALLPTA